MKQLFTLFCVITIILSSNSRASSQGTDYVSLSNIALKKCSKIQKEHNKTFKKLKKQLKRFELEDAEYDKITQHLNQFLANEKWHLITFNPLGLLEATDTLWFNQYEATVEAWLRNVRRIDKLLLWISPSDKFVGLKPELELIEYKGSDRILEIGAGNGEFVITLKLMLPDLKITANEIASTKRIEAKSRRLLTEEERQDVEIVLGEDSTTNCEDEIYDVIIARRVIHHFEKADQMMTSIKQSMSHSSILYVQETFVEDNKEGCSLNLERKDFIALMTKHDLEIIEERKMGEHYSIMKIKLINSDE